MASWMGTAIHTAIEKKLEMQDPWSERFVLEMQKQRDGLMGHIDCYDRQEKEIIDWKTTTKKNLTRFPSDQQKMQVQLYGYLLNSADNPVERVTLVAIPRDGNENDVVVWTEDYDESVALEGLKWLADVEALTEKPAPEKSKFFCRSYCSFYDPSGEIGCPSKERDS